MNANGKFTPPHPLNTAVLFLVFNRLETTKQVFRAIRQAKPPRLYVASDGPRNGRNGESEKVQAVRDFVMQNIDWECHVKTLFRDQNLGCKYAVSSAINWFFENEEQGIILEDDCLPSQSFFWFCEELLERYKDDLRIWHISGNNFQNSVIRGTASYYFSKFNHIWGWASWANRWREYDVEMKSFKNFMAQNMIKDIMETEQERNYWRKIFYNVSNDKIDTWDYQWTYTVWINSGLSVLPNMNLISNIGFGVDATHTTDLDSQSSKIQRHELNFPLLHPFFVLKNLNADKHTFQRFFSKRNLAFRIFHKLKKMVRNDL